MLSTVDAAILCGGQGTRLRSLDLGVPKSMAPIHGRPFLELLVRDLARQGAGRIVLCTGYGREAIRAHFSGGDWGVPLAFSEETAPLGTAGALRQALDQLRGDPILAMNGDSYTPFDLEALQARERATQAEAIVVVAPASERRDAGVIALDAAGWVRDFAEKSARPDAAFHSAGIYLLRRRVLEGLPPGAAASLEFDVLPRLVPGRVAAVAAEGEIVDIGTPERLARAQELLAGL